jgi:anti-sigma factor RsiW
MSGVERRQQAHVAGAELALYVIDGLSPERKDAVESHVLECDACADALGREARVEAALEEVARVAAMAERPSAPVIPLFPAKRPALEGAAPFPVGRRSRWAGGVAGAIAAAAAMVLAFAPATARSEPTAAGAVPRAALHDAAGDMSGATPGSEVAPDFVMRDSLDGG